MAGTTRRNFLKQAGTASLAIGAGMTLDSIVSGCATFGLKETAPVLYPRLKGQKIQPPELGCLIGFWDGKLFFEKETGHKLSISVVFASVNAFVAGFPWRMALPKAKKGLTIMVYAGINNTSLESLAKGMYDRPITSFAEGAVEYGQQYGGFMMNHMFEMNGNWWSFGQRPTKFKDAWRRIVDIFERKGANKYTTWIWEFFCPEASGWADEPEQYYPGDDYVDWIGMSAYARAQFPRTDLPLTYLISNSYANMRRQHPTKPIMIAEFGKTQGPNQANWIINAYKTIKSKPGIKAAVYFDNINDILQPSDQHELNTESWAKLKQILQDPYWITAK